MISHLQLVTVCVSDQDRALDFYTNTLGFDLIADNPFGPARWIEVAPPGAQTRLTLFTPPGMEDRIGTFTGLSFSSKDVRATCEELKARGVTFTQEPAEQPWGGVMAQFADPDGNSFVLHS